VQSRFHVVGEPRPLWRRPELLLCVWHGSGFPYRQMHLAVGLGSLRKRRVRREGHRLLLHHWLWRLAVSPGLARVPDPSHVRLRLSRNRVRFLRIRNHGLYVHHRRIRPAQRDLQPGGTTVARSPSASAGEDRCRGPEPNCVGRGGGAGAQGLPEAGDATLADLGDPTDSSVPRDEEATRSQSASACRVGEPERGEPALHPGVGDTPRCPGHKQSYMSGLVRSGSTSKASCLGAVGSVGSPKGCPRAVGKRSLSIARHCP